MTITADRLRTWSERICTLPSTDARAIVQELGIEGSVVAKFNALVIEPPIQGALEVKAVERTGRFDRISVQLASETLPRAELEQRFGPGAIAPRSDPDSYFTVSYRLDVPGAPFGCDVSAEFATEPTGETPVAGITLRRQPAGPAASAEAQPAAADKPPVTLGDLARVIAQAASKVRQENGATSKPAAPADEPARAAAAADFQKLVDAVSQAGAAARRAVASQGQAVRDASRAPTGASTEASTGASTSSLDLSSVTDALRRFTSLVASGTPESQTKLKELLGQLESTFGASASKLRAVPDEPQHAPPDELRRAQIKQDVQASLDEIFRGKKKP
ncbi:MAG TPA: hypothetical protein VNO30_42425 [Kofleriaceae bacterium]|nr:hypothetical protein [Kofleriaceae bacterium]